MLNELDKKDANFMAVVKKDWNNDQKTLKPPSPPVGKKPPEQSSPKEKGENKS